MRLLRTTAAASAVLVLATTATADLTPTRLRCEYAVNPLGIDEARPQLSWAVESRHRGQVQTAYQILVAMTQDALQADRGDLWDSGKVSSSQTVGVPYAGKRLQSGMRVHWKVRVWDKDGNASDWSPPAWWEMGLLEPGDWQGSWITRPVGGVSDPDLRGSGSESPPTDPYAEHPAPMFRKEFVAPREIRQARLYISGLGYYELHINGERVGDHVLDPAWTSYAKRVFYSTYDVTALLRKGPNALGVILGNGWYNPLPLRMWGKLNLRDALTVGEPRLILQLNIEYVDGTRQSVCSDGSWRAGDSPILKNSVYLGEVYDARREQQGWDSPGFDDARWRPAAVAREPLGALRAQAVEP
ncbi:MAG: alpha-L-rhamnosidase N-terminal domain-containing protein, partial [Phycisphaerae bacterium]